MQSNDKATGINLLNFSSRQMRAFHMTWFAFFLCFFAWFGIAPLMPIVREELNLTKEQVGNTIIASVAITIIVRLFIGWLCDKIGPRLSYTLLLTIGSLPVMGIGYAYNYETFLLFRLAIGAIGASFVITQYHTSVMFAPNCVGTANATVAGWGNLGGGVTQMIMPLIFAGFVTLGLTSGEAWRLSMVVAGILCFVTGIAYFFLTTDMPAGNFKELREKGIIVEHSKNKGSFMEAARDIRVWILFLVYAACFGIEITINNIAALYFTDYFGLGLKTAGLVAGTFGLMNIFARSLGGIVGDRIGQRDGLKGRVKWLFIAILCEGIALILFSRMNNLPLAIGSMIIFSLFVQMSEGATYSVVPFINKNALGSVTGIVAAGGNIGAVAASFLFRNGDISWPTSLLIIGCIIFSCSFLVFLVRFSEADEKLASEELEKALKERNKDVSIRLPAEPGFSLAGLIYQVRPIDALRIFLGGALAIKGVYFILNMQAIETMVGSIGHSQNIISWYVIMAHVIGGACLLFGMGTRLAIALNIPILLGAIFFIHLGEGLFEQQGLQFSIFVLVALFLCLWEGGGKLSVDYLVKKSSYPDKSGKIAGIK